jgi:hypothetical protein
MSEELSGVKRTLEQFPTDDYTTPRGMIEQLVSHPLCEAFGRYQAGAVGSGLAPRNTEPWHAVAEKFVTLRSTRRRSVQGDRAP